MTTLTILRAGPLMSVQDNGRPGYRSFGVSASGAMDRVAHAVANGLVGNEEGAAVVEFAQIGGIMTLDEDGLIAVTGGGCDIRIDGRRVHPWESCLLRAGDQLAIGALRDAVWGYIAFSGGVVTEPVLGSRSTHLRTGLGGLDGGAIEDGDVLPLGNAKIRMPLTLGMPLLQRGGPIRVVPGPQDDSFDQEAWRIFLSREFKITTARDRMAMVLDGPPLFAFAGHDIVSDAAVRGSIQVPGSGKPIVLTADCQTTGGYPKIATVASVDLDRLAQMPTHHAVRFRAISQAQAEAAHWEALDHLAKVTANLRPVRP